MTFKKNFSNKDKSSTSVNLGLIAGLIMVIVVGLLAVYNAENTPPLEETNPESSENTDYKSSLLPSEF